MPQFDITIAGELNLDIILYGLPEELPLEQELLASGLVVTLGSSSAITAHNLRTRNAGWIHHAGRRRRAGESCTRPAARRRRGSHANYLVIHFEHRPDGGSTTHSPTPDSYLCRVHG